MRWRLLMSRISKIFTTLSQISRGKDLRQLCCWSVWSKLVCSRVSRACWYPNWSPRDPPPPQLAGDYQTGVYLPATTPKLNVFPLLYRSVFTYWKFKKQFKSYHLKGGMTIAETNWKTWLFTANVFIVGNLSFNMSSFTRLQERHSWNTVHGARRIWTFPTAGSVKRTIPPSGREDVKGSVWTYTKPRNRQIQEKIEAIIDK